MNIQFNSEHTLFLALLALVVTLGTTFIVYFFRNQKDILHKRLRIILSLSRFLALLFITFLILQPIIESFKKREEKPILLIGIDNSVSMKQISGTTSNINDILSSIKEQTGDNFTINQFKFGEKVEKITDSINFTDRKSDYATFFNEMDERFHNRNVVASILIGDGIYNAGQNPVNLTEFIQYPVYSIATGDTSVISDQAILNVNHNPNVFLGNDFILETELNFTDFNYNQTTLEVTQNGKVTYSETIKITQPDLYALKTIKLTANQPGLQNIHVRLTPMPNEKNKTNNNNRFTIEVHDNKYEILALTQGPHPDLGAIKKSLDKQANFNITTTTIGNYKGKLQDYDLILLNQIPSANYQQSELLDEIKQSNISILSIIGPNSSLSALNNINPGFEIEPSNLMEESTPKFNTSFNLFTIPENIELVSKTYPPLLTPYTKIRTENHMQKLAFQTINNIEMEFPLILCGEKKNKKMAAIMGEGIWRWRLHEYQQFNNSNIFDQLTANLFTYLCLNEKRDQFKVNYNKILDETDPVIFTAQVFNQLYEPYKNAEVKLTLTDSAGNDLNYIFDTRNDYYQLRIGTLPPGTYTFTASTSIGDNEFEEQGRFVIQEVNLEQQLNKANHDLLNDISLKTKGVMVNIDEHKKITEEIIEKSSNQVKIHKESLLNELINWKWVFAIILILISMEWFLRKFWGSY